MIEFRDLSKTFVGREGSHTALQDINLTIADGDIFGIIGPSGAGKSTLVRCINLLTRPTAGQVLIDGEDVTGFKGRRLRDLRTRIGMIFQDFNLFSQRTVLQNVLFPLEVRGGRRVRSMTGEEARAPESGFGGSLRRRQDSERAYELLTLVGLSGMENRYPAQLSGGQQQRVSIARALANRPDYLLCDEATSALDTLTTDSILELIKQINHDLGVTIVIITHAMSVVEMACKNVAVIESSRIAEQGSVREIFSAPKADITRRLLRIEGGGRNA